MQADVVTTSVEAPFSGLKFSAARDAVLAARPELEQALKAKTQSAMEKLAAKGKKKAVLGIKDVEEGRSDIFRINPLLLEVEDGWNSRDVNNPENIAHIEWLSRNIPEVGQITPIEVRNVNGRYLIRDGHCRFFGIALAISRGWACETVKVVTVAPGKNDLDDILQQQLANSTKPLTPIETAVMLQKARATGASDETIAKKLSRDVNWIKSQVRLLEANHSTQQLVAQGAVAATLVSEAVRDHGAAEAAKLIEKGVEKVKAEGGRKVTKATLLALQGRMSPKAAINEALVQVKQIESGEFGEGIEMTQVPTEQWRAILAALKAAQ